MDCLLSIKVRDLSPPYTAGFIAGYGENDRPISLLDDAGADVLSRFEFSTLHRLPSVEEFEGFCYEASGFVDAALCPGLGIDSDEPANDDSEDIQVN